MSDQPGQSAMPPPPQPVREQQPHPAPARAEQKQSQASRSWLRAILFAARLQGVAASPEQVRSASAWAGHATTEHAVTNIALSAGLVGQFVDMPGEAISSVMLPALVLVEGQHVGVIVGASDSSVRLVIPVGDSPVERVLSKEQCEGLFGRRLFLVRPFDKVHDKRVDNHLRALPDAWLSSIFSSNWRVLLELGMGSLCGNMLAIGTSLFAMQVWDRVVPARSTGTLWVLASGVALALMLELLIRTARVSIADHFGKQADLKLSAMFFARVLDIRNDARPRSPGTLISQLRDLEQLRELMTSSTIGVLIDMPFVIGFLAIIWLLGGQLVYVPLAAIPLLILPGLLAQIPLARLSNEGLAETALRNALLMESVFRVEDIKILQAEPRFRASWNEVNTISGEIGLKQRRLGALLVNFSQMVQQLAYVGVVIAGVYGILEGGLSFGSVLACSILTSRTIAPLGQIAAVLGRLQNAKVGKKALDSLLTLPLDHDPDKDAYHKPVLVGSYQFENVVYLYGPDEKPALIIPRLGITPGERIAVLGKVGAGKSTFLRLAAGLASPVQGRILFNNTPMNLIDVADIRRDLGVMLQESGLFYGTLRENLLIANPLATDEQILEAMRLSCADQLLLTQPHALDMKLRENGQGLSGGQKQSLMLARLFLRNPNILLLDEPTASLDEMTEVAIIRRMQAWLGQRTLVVATHRYPVLSLVDRIILIDGGRIVRDGPKDEVLRAMTGGGPPLREAQKPAVKKEEQPPAVEGKVERHD
ncbi:type I secretion system permease/ATPase [Nitratidesulfovibrio termitidis]|uniref:type I secretion system permease/ATPase n=1 Tax=Nitratidesulfovibrio termitidis TaxID=42252 RepID=UPI0018DC17BF|nr:type I secretion system permease/ATPase [Nitratidesulfovibrio termitidis]